MRSSHHHHHRREDSTPTAVIVAVASAPEVEMKGRLHNPSKISDPTVLAQAQALLDRWGAQATLLVLMPNARAAEPYRPLAGYSARVRTSAPFKGEDFNQLTLFKGRAMLPLVDFTQPAQLALVQDQAGIRADALAARLSERLSQAAMAGLADQAIAYAYATLNQAAERKQKIDAFQPMKLRPSTNASTRVLLVENVTNEVLWLVVEHHAMPDETEMVLGDVFAVAEQQQKGLLAVFSDARMLDYSRSQRVLRALAVRWLRRAILASLLGVSDLADTSDPQSILNQLAPLEAVGSLRVSDLDGAVQETITNTVDIDQHSADGQDYLIVYNESFEVRDQGRLGLLTAGPYREAVAVTAGGAGTLETLMSLPFDMPVNENPQFALEAVVQERTSPSDDSGTAQHVISAEGRMFGRRKNVAGDLVAIEHALQMGPLREAVFITNEVRRRALVDSGAASTLLFRPSVSLPSGNLAIPAYLPDEIIDYHLGFDKTYWRGVLQAYGLDLGTATGKALIRPLFEYRQETNTLALMQLTRALSSASKQVAF